MASRARWGWACLGAAALGLAAGPALADEPKRGAEPRTLLTARRGFKTKLARQQRESEPLPAPPPQLFKLVKYPAPLGEMAAYVGVAPAAKDGAPARRHPAIIWITGGFPPGGAGPSVWQPASGDNDQSAKAYRLAGLVMMYPTFRGANGNPGVQEGFFGEVDDVLAAADYLAKLDYVDPKRIFLGGHSTGGTLALLCATATNRFRAVISFGPVGDPLADYGEDTVLHDPKDVREARLRAPIRFISALRTPTLVIEGQERGNVESLQRLRRATKSDHLRCFAIQRANHFDLLAPLNRHIARKIAALEGDAALELRRDELQAAYDADRAAAAEAADLEALARVRRAGHDLGAARRVGYYLLAREEAGLARAAEALAQAGFEPRPLVRRQDREGRAFYELMATKRLTLRDLDALFAASKVVARVAAAAGAKYDGWDVVE